MANITKPASQHLTTILNKVAEDKIYGSVEVYFEAGQITQITQRIINKVTDKISAPKSSTVKNYESRIRPQKQST